MQMQRGQECADWLARCQLSQKTVENAEERMREERRLGSKGRGNMAKEKRDRESTDVMGKNISYTRFPIYDFNEQCLL